MNNYYRSTDQVPSGAADRLNLRTENRVLSMQRTTRHPNRAPLDIDVTPEAFLKVGDARPLGIPVTYNWGEDDHAGASASQCVCV
jgi:hypothetical protein